MTGVTSSGTEFFILGEKRKTPKLKVTTGMLFYYFATQNSEVDYMETNVVFN